MTERNREYITKKTLKSGETKEYTYNRIYVAGSDTKRIKTRAEIKRAIARLDDEEKLEELKKFMIEKGMM